MQEIWVKITGYNNYFVSSKGNVKSTKLGREIILKPWVTDGYFSVSLCEKGKAKKYRVHQLVAIAFLNHSICGFEKVVNHINFNRKDNRLENLEIVSQRENANRKHIKSSSKFTGVSWNKTNKNWSSKIWVNKKHICLGNFKSEKEASTAYENALIAIENNLPIHKNELYKTSSFKGVSWYKRDSKWRAYIYVKRKCIHLGYFSSEVEASNAYQKEFKKRTNEYKTNIKRKERNSEDIHSSLRK